MCIKELLYIKIARLYLRDGNTTVTGFFSFFNFSFFSSSPLSLQLFLYFLSLSILSILVAFYLHRFYTAFANLGFSFI